MLEMEYDGLVVTFCKDSELDLCSIINTCLEDFLVLIVFCSEGRVIFPSEGVSSDFLKRGEV